MLFRLSLLLTMGFCAWAQNSWTDPYPAHRIVGNVYYVGPNDLACFLITSPQGHILINTGLASSVPQIRRSIEQLGFRVEDVKTLLTMQAHYDHVAGMAELQKLTGAQMYATEPDAVLLEDGGRSDYLFGQEQKFHFAPVKVARKLKHGEKIQLGGNVLTVHLHPGHTKGSSSYAMDVAEQGKTYRVLFANMGTINPGTKLVGNTQYPKIADDYTLTYARQNQLSCDVFLSAHGSQYGLRSKHKAEAPYDPARFVDPDGYKKAVASAEKNFRELLAAEKAP